MSTVTAGKLGEDAAVKLLTKRGYKIIARNFRSKFGEIDLIAIDRDTLVFIEVKTRWSREYGYPQEAVTSKKIWSIIKASQYFKLLNPKTPDLMRIDVVAIEKEKGQVSSIELLKNVSQ